MKPLNAGSDACTPISSSCVIWQGPDIECIKLCKGDAISDVVYKLALELCELMEQFNISNYDLACLDLACEPKDFQTLIQILVDKICALEDCCNGTPSGTGRVGCPDCTVEICQKFWYTNELGDLVKTMQLADYVKAIGNKVCQIIDQIATINATLVSLDNRVTILENAPPPTFTLPLVTPVCVLPSAPTQMNIVLTALEQQFCALVGATGQSTAITTAITYQCPDLTNSPQLSNSSSAMGNLAGWNSSVSNLAQSFTNMWLTICDLRSAVSNILANCCNEGCSEIGLELTAVLSGTNIRIFVTGNVPAGYTYCAGYTSFTITDGATPSNSVSFSGPNGYDILNAITNPSLGVVYPLASTVLNLSTNLTIQMSPCFVNNETGTTCQSYLSYIVITQNSCPTLTAIAGSSSTVIYNGTTIGPASPTYTYTIELWTSTGVSPAQTQTQILGGGATFNGTFSGLAAPTQYKVRVKITTPSGIQECPFTPLVTLPAVATCSVPILPPGAITFIIAT